MRQPVLAAPRSRLHEDQHGSLDLGRMVAKRGADAAAAVAANVKQRGVHLQPAGEMQLCKRVRE